MVSSSSVFLLLLCPVFTFFGGRCIALDCFQFPCHLGSHIPSLMVDKVCAAFSCEHTMVWPHMVTHVIGHRCWRMWLATDVDTCDWPQMWMHVIYHRCGHMWLATDVDACDWLQMWTHVIGHRCGHVWLATDVDAYDWPQMWAHVIGHRCGRMWLATDVDTCDCTWGLYKHHERVCTESWLSEKNVRHTRESNLHQHHARSDAQPAELTSHHVDGVEIFINSHHKS